MGNQKSALLTNQIKEKMSEPIQIPSKLKLQSSNQGSAAGSPLEVARVGIAPTSFTTRRTRTTSVTKKIDEKYLEDGTVLAFSRTKGHGFLKGSGGDSIFFHVSDVNGEVRFQLQNYYQNFVEFL